MYDLTVNGHCYFYSMRNSGDFSSQICTFVRKDYCSALKRPHSSVQEIITEFETLDIPQIHDSWLENKYSPELKIGLGSLD